MTKFIVGLKWASMGLLAALASSACCILPLLALITGVGTGAAVSWLDPFRPYLAGGTLVLLGLAWVQKLNPAAKGKDCNCEEPDHPSFWNSGKFLSIITVGAILLLSVPYLVGQPGQQAKPEMAKIDQKNVVEASIFITGMTCSSCEHHVNQALAQYPGVVAVSSSYKNGSATVAFDSSQFAITILGDVLKKETGYQVTGFDWNIASK
jgi:copper chaperone CopZ